MKSLTQNINGVEYPLYRLINTSDESPIKDRCISNTLDVPNPGPGQAFLPISVDDYPTYDSNYSTVEIVEQNFKGEWQITYLVVDKSKDEMLKAADQAKRIQASSVVSNQDVLEKQLTVIAAVIRASGYKFSPEDQVFVDDILAQSDKLASNRTKLSAAQAAIDLGQKPDLKSGWAADVVEVAGAAGAALKP